MSGVRGEDSGGRKRFLRTLQENNKCFREFGEDVGQEEQKDDEEETETYGVQYSHRIFCDG